MTRIRRRDFIIRTGITGMGLSLLPLTACDSKEPTDGDETVAPDPSAGSASIEQPPLGYDYAALEPYIDARTMEIHYSKHHAGYVRKLNAALDGHRLGGGSLDEVLAGVTRDEQDVAVLNNAGGTANHNLFWTILTPGGAAMPEGDLRAAIDRDFGSYEAFANEFSEAAGSVFGSGWAWLVRTDDGTLVVTETANQDSPLMRQVADVPGTPVLGLDVWEHAYYLKYQNRRGEYIANAMKAINWTKVGDLWALAGA